MEENANSNSISGYLNVSITHGEKRELIHKSNWNRTYLVVENGELLTYQFVKGNVRNVE
jgi:hypothetical protein